MDIVCPPSPSTVKFARDEGGLLIAATPPETERVPSVGEIDTVPVPTDGGMTRPNDRAAEELTAKGLETAADIDPRAEAEDVVCVVT